MAASSSKYCARIRADTTARKGVLASGLVLAAAGSLALWQMPAEWLIRGLGEIIWWCGSSLELCRCWRRFRDVAGFCLYPDGSADIEARDGTRSGGVIAAGTVLLRHVAWIRCRGSDGRLYAELIARNTQERDDWRRFRVICRHVSAC